MGLISRIFGKNEQDVQNGTMTGRRAPITVDLTENIKINGELTRGLLHNTYPGYKLAGGLAYAPIMTPVSIMGMPVPISESEQMQELLKKFVETESNIIDQVHISSHGDGTIWAWPYFDSYSGSAKLELILDDCISDILIDPVSKRIIEVIQSEQMSITDGFGSTKIVDRKRSWTIDQITDEINGRKTIYKNILKIFPVPFSNEPDVNKIRGNSDLARIVPYLKAHHNVRLKWATNLSKMNPKLVQEGGTISDWMANNGYSDINDIDGASIDFIYNNYGKEKTSFLMPTGLGDEYVKFLQQNYWEIVEASSIPELAWGLLSTGNHASAEEQMERLMSYCRKKQRQHTEKWAIIFRSVGILEGMANMINVGEGIEVKWNRLDALSEKTKAEIFEKISNSVEKMTTAGVPGETIHKQLKSFYPDSVIESWEEFKTQRADAAKFRAFKDSSYIEIIDTEEP